MLKLILGLCLVIGVLFIIRKYWVQFLINTANQDTQTRIQIQDGILSEEQIRENLKSKQDEK